MFTKIKKNREKSFIFILAICFITAFLVLLYVDRTSAQSLPQPPINKNESEDLNLFAGTAIGGNSNILLYVDFSQSMGTNPAGVQTANWDQTYPIFEDSPNPCNGGIQTGTGGDRFCTAGSCVEGQLIEASGGGPEPYAVAHCALNATGITNELIDKDGFVIHNAYDTITITTDSTITISTIHPDDTIMRTTDGIVVASLTSTAFQGVFGGCGSRACTRSKFGTCENQADFNRFLQCIDIAYSDLLCPTCPTTSDETIVKSVFANAAEINCSVDTTTLSSILALASDTDIVNSLESGLKTACNTDRKRIHAAAAMDNYSNYLWAETKGSSANDFKTCGAAKCITFNNLGSTVNADDFEPDSGPNAVEDHSCNNNTVLNGLDSSQNVDELARFAACMDTQRKQPFVKTCSTGTTDGPYCSPAKNGSTRSDAMMTVVAQVLDRDSSVKTTTCSDTPKLFNGVDSTISCFNYMNTPFRDLGDIPDPTGGSDLPTTAGGDTIESFFTTNDEDLAPFRLGSANFSEQVGTCESNSNYNSDQGGLAGMSTQQFDNTLGEFTSQVPTGRTALANAIGFDDSDESSSTISDDILGIYRVALQTDNLSKCRAHFSILITDGEDNCSGDCSSNAAFGADGGSCDASLPPQTGNSNRRSMLQAASNSRTFFGRFGLNKSDPDTDPDKFIDTEIFTFYIGWGVEDNPEAVRTLNTAALLGGTHTSGILRHRNPQGFISGSRDLDPPTGVSSFLLDSDLDEIRSNFTWMIEMADMETDNGSFDRKPEVVTLQDCGPGNEDESGDCTWNGTDVFDNNFFTGTAGTDLPTALTRTTTGLSFAFFVSNPAELIAALETIFNLAGDFSAVGQAPSVPPSVTAIGLRDRVLIPSFNPAIGDPLWQGRLALFGFLEDPDNPGGRIIVRKPRTAEEFLDGPGDQADTLFDPDALRSANIFTDTGSLNSNAEEFFWDAGKLLAERDIVSSARRLLTVDPTKLSDADLVKTLQIDSSDFDAIVYTSGLVAFDTSLEPEVFGISDADVDPAGVGSVISICSDLVASGAACETDCSGSLTAACKTCIKENCLRDKVVSFMSGKTGLLPVRDTFGEPTIEACSTDIFNNSERGVIGCGCPELEFTNTNVVDPFTTDGGVVISSLANCERRLGDIFHSQAKIVQAPSLLFFDTGFSNFARQFRNRSAVIYAGANDGFLHAFHGGDFIDLLDPLETFTDEEKRNPFTGFIEELPFVNEGTGNELFGFAPPTFLVDSVTPDGTVDTEIDVFDGITVIDATRRIFTGLTNDYDPTSILSLVDAEYSTTIVVSSEPLPDFRTGDFKTIVTKNLAGGYLGDNIVGNNFNNFQRSFFDGTPFIVDVFLDGTKEQANGIPDSVCDASDDPESGKIDGIISTCGKEWHTILMSGFRNGGGGFTALDITNMACANDACTSTSKKFSDGPDYPEHLWTLFDRDMGNSWSQPKAGRVRIKFEGEMAGDAETTVDRWVVFAGGGLEPYFTNPVGNDDHPDTAVDESANTLLNYEEPIYKGNVFYAIDIATGEIIFKFDDDDDSNFVCDTPADPNVIDVNADGYIDIVYLGDKCGRMWRFDVSEPIEAGIKLSTASDGILSDDYQFSAPDWSGSAVFCANDPEAESGGSPVNTCLSMTDDLRKPLATDTLFPIYFAPTSVIDNDGKRHVIFTTGDRAWPSNADKYGYLYNFIDEYIPSFIRGSTNPTTETFKTIEDIVDTTVGGTLLTISSAGTTGDGLDLFSISGPADDPNGEYLIEFANGCDTTNDNTCAEGGEKGIGTPVVIERRLLFTTFVPESGEIEECSAGLGQGRIFGIDFITGQAALGTVPGAEGVLGGANAAGIEGGEGMPTPPQLTYTSTGTVTMSLAFSGSGVVGGAQFLIWELPRLPSNTQSLYWEEVI